MRERDFWLVQGLADQLGGTLTAEDGRVILTFDPEGPPVAPLN